MFGLRRMKHIEFSVLKIDIDTVLEYLGTKAEIHFTGVQTGKGEAARGNNVSEIKKLVEKLYETGSFLGIDLESDMSENKRVSYETAQELAADIYPLIEEIKERQEKTEQEILRIREAIYETRAFAKLNIPFSDFDHLSFLSLRIGRIDPKSLPALRENLSDRALLIPLDDTSERILAASSKKGRFALDTHLNKFSFEPVSLPEDKSDPEAGKIPAQILESLEVQCRKLEDELEQINLEKKQIKKSREFDLKNLAASLNIKYTIEKIKAGFTETESLYHFSGWMPEDLSERIVKDLSEKTGGRIAVNAYSPHEVPSIKNGKEKVPVAMKHSSFVKGFEGVVFSYGVQLYGTIDPTPLVAFFFTLMFGIMFGDAGQGLVLLLLGILASKSKKYFSKFKKFAVPLISVGIASVIMGILSGSVFTNEKLLISPARAVTNLITGNPADRILHILPMAGEGASITKLLYFFAFTVAIGVIINSLGLLINIYNRLALRKYKAAFFSKTGIPGLFIFWYALFFAVRLALGSHFMAIDFICFLIPCICIVFGDLIFRIITGAKPLLENGVLAFVIEGFVEIMETVSSYFSNTVSFLRVGAFALAHAVFSFIVFYFTDILVSSGLAGTLSAALLMIAGNAIIIALEGLIVAVQVMRLQYYEFFNKFFIETGVEFAPFRFHNRESI